MCPPDDTHTTRAPFSPPDDTHARF
jgi:hypothetical protein